MTPTPPSTNSPSSAGGHHSPDLAHRIVRKRNRVPLSCAPCRHRKLKCNRSHPCDNCTKRGDAPSCSYAAPGNRKRNNSSTDSGPNTPDEMQDRIDRLESLVLSLMNNGGQVTGPAAAVAAMSGSRSAGSTDLASPQMQDDEMQGRNRDEDSEVERVSNSIGVMKVQNDRHFFVSEAHWFAILSDISEVKSYFADHKKQYEEQIRKVRAADGASSIGKGLLFKGQATVDRSEIQLNFPPREVANRLISRYFDSENPATHILHRPTFVKQYDRHWQNPQESSVAWLGMCFAMMCLALQSYHRAGEEPPEYRDKSWQVSLSYLEWTTHCMVHVDYTQPVNFMIETLCFYLQAEHARSRDTETSVWILSAIIMRLAMRMGLHRDSKPYKSVSPYQGEMRRRIWNFIHSADILLSFQCGMPCMVNSADTDTELPRNLYDEEFEENSMELPPARPLTQNTPMSFMIVNGSLTFVLGKILEESNRLASTPYEVIMKLDEDLREVRNDIPQNLRLKSMEDSALDSASLIMQCFTIDLIYNKSQLILHRKFLSRSRDNPRFAYSRRTCVEACMEMLRHQIALHTECQPRGRLHSISWSVTSSIVMADFFLAAMIICLDLYHTAQAESKGQTSDEMYIWAAERRDAMFTGVEHVVAIWESMRDQSMEAYKASTALRVMLDKLKNQEALRQQLNQNISFVQINNGVAPDGQVAPEHSAAMTLGMMSSGGLTPEAMSMFDRGYQVQGAAQRGAMNNQAIAGAEQMGATMPQQGDPFANLFGPMNGFQGIEMSPANIDWADWAEYIEGNVPGQGMVFDPAFTDENGAQVQAPTDPIKIQGDPKVPTPHLTHLYAPNNAGIFLSDNHPQGS